LLVFEFLIFIHEFGHYITARIFGVTITEFSLGFGPELVSYESKKTGIKYKLAAFPLGGFVAMVGEDEESDDPNSFDKKPAWQRFIITAAGATVNIVAGFLAMIIIVSFINIGNTTYGAPMDDELLHNLGYETVDDSHRSYEAGLQMGDEIVKVNGKRVRIYDELSYQIMRYGNESVELTVIRDGEEIVLPDVNFPTTHQQGQTFGIIDFKITGYVEKGFFKTIGLSVRKAALVMRMCWESIIDLITGRYTVEAVSGPVGISAAIGDAASAGFLSLLNITVLISMNLGFMNLVPFPALDGGRLITILVEMVSGKKIPTKIEGIINTVGITILFALMILILFKDTISLIF
jgi:regulator of sigma E protease